ncbi:PAS domain S-box protein [Gigaspora margarita]|uniref:PAS domain S-box protein n=1 Tax=Gigaspora margarita TaxID=4874 RepID=A0A8H4AJM5_GIGMA|nr:PAS domain S-box protein [Gigaspora margarita]
MENNSVSNSENSDLSERFYNYDWSSTSFGSIDSWEPQIKSIVNLCFNSGCPTFISMGQDLITIYNEAAIPVMKLKHPQAFIKPAIEIWGETPELIAMLYRVIESGKGECGHDLYMEIQRDGYKEEVYIDYAHSPIYKLDGTVWGLLTIAPDTTQKVLNKRRLNTLNKLSCLPSGAESLESTCQILMKALQNHQDIPYALIYLIENNKDPKTGFNSTIARLVATTFDEVCKEELIHKKLKRHIPDYFPETHETIELTKISDQNYMDVKCARSTYSFLRCDSWPINLVMKEEKSIQVLLKDNSQAILLPIKLTFCNERNLSAVLICGINPLCKLDDKYMEFYKSVLNYVNRILIRGMSIEEEKRRAKILSDLNHQKDMFFKSISHELKRFEKGANNYLKKPFSSQELILRIYDTIKLSNLRHKILYQQYKQEAIKQFLFTISEMINSGNNLIETLSNIIKKIPKILPCDRILIISYGSSTSNTSNGILVALYENLENNKSFQNEEIINLQSQSINSQTSLNNNSGIEISLNKYCTNTCKSVSMLSIKLKINNSYWGCIKLHRPLNSIWLNSEIELLQQISNQISLAIFYKTLMEENLEKEIQVKAETFANKTKTQILANTSHELRTPLGAIIGLIPLFDQSTLTNDQKDMINIIQYTSDFVLSIVNKILNIAKLEMHQITSINTTFDLLDLFEKTIEQFIKDIENKQIELILNYDIETLPRYIRSDSERLKQVLFYLLLNS